MGLIARFAQPVVAPVAPDMMVVGQAWGPTILPDYLITVTPDQVGYTDLFSFVTPGGQPARGPVSAGTYGHTTGAMRRH